MRFAFRRQQKITIRRSIDRAANNAVFYCVENKKTALLYCYVATLDFKMTSYHLIYDFINATNHKKFPVMY